MCSIAGAHEPRDEGLVPRGRGGMGGRRRRNLARRGSCRAEADTQRQKKDWEQEGRGRGMRSEQQEDAGEGEEGAAEGAEQRVCPGGSSVQTSRTTLEPTCQHKGRLSVRVASTRCPRLGNARFQSTVSRGLRGKVQHPPRRRRRPLRRRRGMLHENEERFPPRLEQAASMVVVVVVMIVLVIMVLVVEAGDGTSRTHHGEGSIVIHCHDEEGRASASEVELDDRPCPSKRHGVFSQICGKGNTCILAVPSRQSQDSVLAGKDLVSCTADDILPHVDRRGCGRRGHRDRDRGRGRGRRHGRRHDPSSRRCWWSWWSWWSSRIRDVPRDPSRDPSHNALHRHDPRGHDPPHRHDYRGHRVRIQCRRQMIFPIIVDLDEQNGHLFVHVRATYLGKLHGIGICRQGNFSDVIEANFSVIVIMIVIIFKEVAMSGGRCRAEASGQEECEKNVRFESAIGKHCNVMLENALLRNLSRLRAGGTRWRGQSFLVASRSSTCVQFLISISTLRYATTVEELRTQ
eukprot:2150734-Rhodomonas_salina.2